jgi:sugar phosphate isomerase/epimerase
MAREEPIGGNILAAQEPSRIALAALTIPDADPVEFVRVAAAAGFDAVGLTVCASGHMRAPLAESPALCRDVKQRLGDAGLDVLEVGVFRLAPDTNVADLVPALNLGAALGAKHATVCGAPGQDDRMGEAFRNLCQAAGERGMRAVLEFVPYLYPRNLAEAHLLVRRAGHGAGICVDALHFCRSGAVPDDIGRIDADLFPYVQFCDAASAAAPASTEDLMREARTDRRYPGEGALPLAALLRAMPRSIPLSVESPCQAYAHLPPAERARRAASATRRVLESVWEREQEP